SSTSVRWKRGAEDRARQSSGPAAVVRRTRAVALERVHLQPPDTGWRAVLRRIQHRRDGLESEQKDGEHARASTLEIPGHSGKVRVRESPATPGAPSTPPSTS